MLRFAPSPTGEMHIGDLRLAILNYIVSKQLNEDLLIRIDDTDKEKNIEGKDKEILEILALFSIESKGVVYQSENIKYHQKMAMQLMTQKKAFACFCSDEKLNELKEEAKKEGKTYSYDGFCSTLSDETVLNCNAPFTVRISKPIDNIQFNDQLKSKLVFTPSQIDSFFILNHDKLPTADYACAVDDMLYNISTIIRSEEHVLNTPRQIHVRHLLGYDKEINYIHIPNIKSDVSSVKSLIDDGFLPSAISNYLVLLENKTPKEIFTLEEAIEWFDIKNIAQTPAQFDMDKLRLINKKHLEMMDDMRLSKILGFADEDIGKLGKLYLEEAHTIKELKSKIEPIFAAKTSCNGFEEPFKVLKGCLINAPFFTDFKELETYITNETQLKEEELYTPLRYILTGENEGPHLSDIYPLIKNYLGEIVK